MSDTAVAFPDDETSAEVIASRLRAEGIAARVDRGLYGAYLSPVKGQLTVVVAEGDAERAKKVVGPPTRAKRRR
jgi:hypothetical protein